MLLLKILGAVAALLLGIWLGLPGRYTQSREDIERAMDRGGARRNLTKRHFTPLDWFRKEERGSQKRRQRRHFRTAAPDWGERDD
jgi:hypothetical protein